MSFREKQWIGVVSDVETLGTLLFDTFMFCKIFNLPNSRFVAPSLSLKNGLVSNSLFLVSFFGKSVVHTTGFTWRR
jgi:hypothetical protein